MGYDALRLSSELEQQLIGPAGRVAHYADVPWMALPPGFSFQVTFPFTGAAARFRVRKETNPGREVSVYLDTRDVLGCFGSPYWEAYPIDGNNERYALGDGLGLMSAIVAELERPESVVTP